MLEVEPAGRRGRTVTGSGRHGNEVVAGAASEAFAMWLLHRHAPEELPSAGYISFRCTILCYYYSKEYHIWGVGHQAFRGTPGAYKVLT